MVRESWEGSPFVIMRTVAYEVMCLLLDCICRYGVGLTIVGIFSGVGIGELSFLRALAKFRISSLLTLTVGRRDKGAGWLGASQECD